MTHVFNLNTFNPFGSARKNLLFTAQLDDDFGFQIKKLYFASAVKSFLAIGKKEDYCRAFFQDNSEAAINSIWPEGLYIDHPTAEKIEKNQYHGDFKNWI
jgi:hypothetical protein